MSPLLDFGFHFRWDFIHYAAFSPLLFHPLAHITTTNTVPFVLRPFTLCWDVFALFYLPPLCLIAAHLMTHSLNLTSGIRDLVVIGSVLFEYSLAGYLGSTGERKRREYGQELDSFGFLFYEDVYFLDSGSRLR